jgi:hypothetical protein
MHTILMPPKKAISKCELTTDSLEVCEPVIKTRKTSKKELTDKKELTEDTEVVKKIPKSKTSKKLSIIEESEKQNDTIIEEPEKKSKKTKNVSSKKSISSKDTLKNIEVNENSKDILKNIEINENLLDTKEYKIVNDTQTLPKTDNIEYNVLKLEWATLCDKIKEANKEKELLEIQKNQLLNKLWKLGETSYPKSDKMFDIMSKTKPIQTKLSSIQSKILDNDESNSDSSDSESSDSDSSDSESKKPKRNKINIKKSIKSDSSDSDSD